MLYQEKTKNYNMKQNSKGHKERILGFFLQKKDSFQQKRGVKNEGTNANNIRGIFYHCLVRAFFMDTLLGRGHLSKTYDSRCTRVNCIMVIYDLCRYEAG